MKEILFVLFAFSLIISGLILQINIVDIEVVNTTSWNFTGAPIAISLVEWLGGIFMLVGVITMIYLYREAS